MCGDGTTIVTALFYEDVVTIASVGDSRLYLLRDDALQQLTVDHTVLQNKSNWVFFLRMKAEGGSTQYANKSPGN